MDGKNGEATSATVGCILLPGVLARTDLPQAALKKTTCGCCGRVQMGWYDRKVRRVRILSCGDTRIFLELEVRRVD